MKIGSQQVIVGERHAARATQEPEYNRPVNVCEYRKRLRPPSRQAMVILALDTTTAHGSVALSRDGRLLEAEVGDPAVRQGQRLPGDLEALLARHGLTTASVDRYAVALGPGSFTGLRVGIATIQGLALVHNRPVVGLSVMDALVDVATQRYPRRHRGPAGPDGYQQPDIIIPWVDAKRGELFAALYAPAADDTATWRPIDGPVAESAESLLERWAETFASRRVVVLGDGVPGTRAQLDTHLQPRSSVIDELPPLAAVMAQMASVEPWSTKASTPHALRPVYVRRHYAEVARAKSRPGPHGDAGPDAPSAPGSPT